MIALIMSTAADLCTGRRSRCTSRCPWRREGARPPAAPARPRDALSHQPLDLLLNPPFPAAAPPAGRFGKPYGLRVCAAFGGLSKHQQFKELKAGAEAAVATPGRMIDLIKMKACSMRRATYLVFDEADRMFDMGFEPQVRGGSGLLPRGATSAAFEGVVRLLRCCRLGVDALLQRSGGEGGLQCCCGVHRPPGRSSTL